MKFSDTETWQHARNRYKNREAATRDCMNLVPKSSPSFRGKLAEREEAIPLRRLLFHNGFLKTLIIRTIRISREKPP